MGKSFGGPILEGLSVSIYYYFSVKLRKNLIDFQRASFPNFRNLPGQGNWLRYNLRPCENI
ncbi:hypothetical protein UR09_02575 [Candidatus Nitromaritima sp. SCGC AAA799-A02]|nr:hypothetical protein UR09_02575 [Candidatus Nitromaritima sp. SCGC AAA799-A02]